MLLALLSDVHANLPALQAALDAARRRGAEQVLFAGDAVGDGPFPTEVVALLREQCTHAIHGNVDRAVLRVRKSVVARLRRLRPSEGKRRNRTWTARNLNAGAREWLTAIPGGIRTSIGGADVYVVHGSPQGDQDAIFPSITATGLRTKLGDARPGVLVCGHTHIPFTREILGVRVVNCGSVGRPKDGDPRGSFALVALGRGAGRHQAEVVRFTYDVEAVVRALRERDVPGVHGREYRRGIKG